MSFTVVLINPQIPPNTGNIARLCAVTDCRLHIVGEIGFSLDDKQLKRAGMDYWKHVDWTYFPNLEDYLETLEIERTYFLTSKSNKAYFNVEFKEGDFLVFGSEAKGLPKELLEKYKDRALTIPMKKGDTNELRCINLSTSVGIVLYEAIRQNYDLFDQ